MAQHVSNGTLDNQPHGEIQRLGTAKIVLEHFEIVRQRETIKVPHVVFEEVPTTKYVTQELPTIKYISTEEPTTRYNVIEEPTIKFNVHQEETIQYIPRTVIVDRPVVVDKSYEVKYEKPIIIEKEYTVLASKDMVLIKELAALVPVLLEELRKLRRYTLVEEVVRVPKIQYEPTTVERVVWKDIARCSKCGGLV